MGMEIKGTDNGPHLRAPQGAPPCIWGVGEQQASDLVRGSPLPWAKPTWRREPDQRQDSLPWEWPPYLSNSQTGVGSSTEVREKPQFAHPGIRGPWLPNSSSGLSCQC